MMTRLFHTLLLAGALLSLPGCVSRNTADATLAKGCEAGIRALLPEGSSLVKISETKFSPSPEGSDLRLIRIKAVESDGWTESDKDYSCVFEESFGPFNLSHSATIYQVNMGERIVGRVGNRIEGSTDDFLKLTEAVSLVIESR